MSIITLLLISILTIGNNFIKNNTVKKYISNILPILYFGVWIIFLIAYYFHDFDISSRNATLDFGGMVLFWGIFFSIRLWRNIFNKNRIILNILGLIPLMLICIIFIYLAPLNSELEGYKAAFYPIPWYVYYFLGIPLIALHYTKED